jgi:hypothetical protein
MLRRTVYVVIPLFITLLTIPVEGMAQPPSFGNRRDLGASHAPRAIATADLNGDGYPDLVLGGTNPPTVTILLNSGAQASGKTERFGAPTVIDVGGGPFDLAVGDLNRDGKPDIAVANADSNAVTLLFGTGNGLFSAPIDIPVAENPRGIALGDFNRDGILDIIVTKYAGTTLDILYGAGNGTFPTRRSLSAPTVSQGVAVADFNNDGWLDAAVASNNGTIAIYSMSATGATRYDGRPTGDGWNVIAAVDFDGNGRMDVVVASSASNVVSGMYNFDFGWGAINPVSVAASPRGIAVGDLNADGHPDIVVAGRAASMVSVVTRVDYASNTATDFPAGPGSRAVAVADVDRDGQPDIITANEFGNSVTVLYDTLMPPHAGYAFDRTVLARTEDYNQVFAVADFNHNGIPDLVQPNLVLIDGKTPSRRLGQFTAEAGVAADFNGDGNLDVAYAISNTLQVFFGDGHGGFTDGPATATTAGFANRMRTADVNRDGRPDLAVLTGSDTGVAAEIYLGRADATFARSASLPGKWFWLELGDLDRDGIIDVVTSSPSDGVHVFLGDGSGGVKATTSYGAGTSRFGFALGDVTEDGILDLVVTDGDVLSFGAVESSRLTVARGHGDGTFETIEQHDTADPGGDYHALYSVLIGDITGDGHPDILTSRADLLPGLGAGTFGSPQRFVGESPVSGGLLADFNGDGLLDVVGYTDPAHPGDNVIMMNTRRQQNRPPAGLAMPDRIPWAYEQYWADTDENYLDAGFGVSDPDMHALQYRWTLEDGTVVSTLPRWTPRLNDGSYQVTVTASDERGGSISDTFTLDVPPFKETVLIPGEDADRSLHGAWQVVADPTAASGYRVWHPNAGAPKLAEPLPNPVNYFDISFLADPSQDYKLWIRLKAEDDNWANDSVFVQFTGAQDAAGNPVYQIGTTSALAVNLEECSNCGVSGWGWEDDGWGAVNKNGTTLRFPQGGPQIIRIQTREDGVSIDQIVLSSERYKTARPGAAKNDTVKLDHMGPYFGPPQD